jgi:hypothetical protein
MEIEFDRKFCVFLEYEICRYFEENYDENTKGFWCDGVIFERADEKAAYFKIFTGKTGQMEYKLKLTAREKALAPYKENQAKAPENRWLINAGKLSIDVGNRDMTIELE